MDEIEKLPDYIDSCDIFYHFAWEGTRKEARNDNVLQNKNVENSLKTLKTAKLLGCKIFFTAGSQAEYGNQETHVTEQSICKPTSAYGIAKLEFYQKAKIFCEENNIKLFEPRFYSVYGPGDFNETLIMSIIPKMRNNEDIDLSLCTQKWNFIYIKDTVNILIKLSESNLDGGIFNIASKETKPLKEYILKIKEILNSKSNLLFGKINSPLVNLNPDITKIEKSLNWKEKYTFEQGIKETIASIE